MADISSQAALKRVQRTEAVFGETRVYEIDFVRDGVAAHNTLHVLPSIPIGYALTGGYVAFLVDSVAAGATTIQFLADAVALTGAITYATQLKGNVFRFYDNNGSTTTAVSRYAHTAAMAVTMQTSNTNTFTAGRFLLVYELAPVLKSITNG